MSSDTNNPPKNPAKTTTIGISRRQALKGTAAAAAGVAIGSGAITGFPTIWAQNIKNVTLRQFGTGVSNLNAVADKVKEDLGFTLQMTALDSDAVSQRAVTQPSAPACAVTGPGAHNASPDHSCNCAPSSAPARSA